MTKRDTNDFFRDIDKIPSGYKDKLKSQMEHMKIPKERGVKTYKPYKCVKEWIPDGEYIGTWHGAHIEVLKSDCMWMIQVSRDVASVSVTPVQVKVEVKGKKIKVTPTKLNTEGLEKLFG